MKTKIFVYGTLKKGFHNHGFLKSATYIGDAWTKKEYTLLTDHYNGLPYVIREPSYPIQGELYEVDEFTFMTIDNLEGHPHFYYRELVDLFIPLSKDKQIDERGWLYFLGDDFDTRAVRKNPTGLW